MTRYALITGASRRLGLTLTENLLNEGWHVLALTRSPSEQLSALQCDRLDIHPCLDLSNANFESIVAELSQQYPHLDLIVHNASIYEKDPHHSAGISEFYDRLYQIHMKLPSIINNHFAELLKKANSKNPNIIHITDIYAENPNHDYSLYCSTKAALENLNKSFAKKLAPEVRVNSIQPGPMKFLPEHSEADKEKVLSETLLAYEA
ncbi:MAG: SDR family NAD(P)-dependent oxidoreductase, partial [Gammaproteobacteria bacterium]|nr:SDR family NAD(P)-dependent oxidoreductase [Gammaproteobacteria bacterium]